MKHIKVFAPGTVANLGCGFDVMGLTLDGVGDVLEVGVAENAEGFEIRNRSGMELPGNVEENVITPAVRALLEAYGRPVRIEVEILEKIAPGSGIGSSAASSAAAVYGVNELLGRPFSGKQLVEFAMMGEALLGGTPHADNVGPALLGGVVLVRGYRPFDIVRLPVPDNFFYAVAHPGIVVSTREAREALPKRIPLSDAVAQWGNVGGLVAGFALRDVALIGRSMHDVVAEPYRKGFIPGYDALKEQVLAGGALAMNIAGSGPSVFALASNYEAAVRISGEMKRHFEGLGIGCNSYAGCRITKAKDDELLQYERSGTGARLFAARGRDDGAGPRRGAVRPRTDSAGRHGPCGASGRRILRRVGGLSGGVVLRRRFRFAGRAA